MRHGNKAGCFFATTVRRRGAPSAGDTDSGRCAEMEDRILDLTVNGYADFVITGDADVLAIDPFRRTRIVTPADFPRGD